MNNDLITLQKTAIDTALKGDFQKAVDLNKEIILLDDHNLDGYLCLAFAYFQLNDLKNARKYYQKALKLQPLNQIAKNNLEKIKILEKKGQAKTNQKNPSPLDPTLFLNVPGKTKSVPLVNLGHINLVAKLKVGQKVYVKIKKRRIEIRNENYDYIGTLPDDISKRLIFFIKAQSQYTAYIKEASKNQVEVFLKEEKKGKKVARYTSFPRNIQDDLKIMGVADEDNQEIDKTPAEEETKPVDLEALAEEIDEKEHYADESHFEEEKDDLEE